MLQEEFKRLTDKPFTEEEFEKIHYVYIFYPGIVTHADIALIWAIGGIRLIEDMLPAARKIDEAEQRVRAARTRYETAKEHLNYEKVCPAIYPGSHAVCAASDLGYCNRNCMVAFDSICETSGTVEVKE